ESYFELVVARLTRAGYRWYETANFCRGGDRDLRAAHNLGVWRGRDYLGLGIGAVSTVDGLRWRNAPSLPRYLAALERGERPERLGLLTQPHTSAGRVPTEAGYRLYVDALLTGPEPARPEFALGLVREHSEVAEALQATTEMLSQLTRLLALVSAPPLQAATL